jgi:hypothetical protein
VSPVKYELGFYIPEDDILHSHRYQGPIKGTRSEYETKEKLVAVLQGVSVK